MTTQLKLIPFLCYAKEDKTVVREFFNKLKTETWIDPWFDEEDILPGEVWQDRVIEAVGASHAVIIFLSRTSLSGEGFFHREINLALYAAAEKPEGTIFIIPIRIDDCIVPDVLLKYQYVDYFGSEEYKSQIYSALINSLKSRAVNLKILV